MEDIIQEAHPLKQGLKLNIASIFHHSYRHSRGTSIKTRIETILRRTVQHGCNDIQEAHPLKQGLKLRGVVVADGSDVNSRGTSIKTRIETCKR